MYKVRIQLFTDESQEKFEEWNGEVFTDTALECVPKFRGYIKEVSTDRQMVLCGCHDQYWTSIFDDQHLTGSGRIILVALPSSTEFYPVLCQVDDAEEELTVGSWYSLGTLKQRIAKISITESEVCGPNRKVQRDKLEREYHNLVKELPELYRDIFRCLNFTKTYEF